MNQIMIHSLQIELLINKTHSTALITYLEHAVFKLKIEVVQK